MALFAFKARVEGRVQGVAFRYYAKDEAERLSVSGWVHNNDNGSVEVWAEGSAENLRRFEQWLHNGPPHARVDAVHTEWGDPLGVYHSFSIK
jgi:acylphosphatase